MPHGLIPHQLLTLPTAFHSRSSGKTELLKATVTSGQTQSPCLTFHLPDFSVASDRQSYWLLHAGVHTHTCEILLRVCNLLAPLALLRWYCWLPFTSLISEALLQSLSPWLFFYTCVFLSTDLKQNIHSEKNSNTMNTCVCVPSYLRKKKKIMLLLTDHLGPWLRGNYYPKFYLVHSLAFFITFKNECTTKQLIIQRCGF